MKSFHSLLVLLLLVAISLVQGASDSSAATVDNYFANTGVYDFKGCPNSPQYLHLSFDDGPSQFTPNLLDVLKVNNVSATFFLIGSNLAANPTFQATARRALQEGHLLASHTVNHVDLTTLTDADVIKEVDGFADIFSTYIIPGKRPVYFRPPYGNIDQRVSSILHSRGYNHILWTIDTMDWDFIHKNIPDQIVPNYNQILPSVPVVAPGVVPPQGLIHLQHDITPQSVATVADIIGVIRSKGYKLVSLQECIGQAFNGPAYVDNGNVTVSTTVITSTNLVSSTTLATSTILATSTKTTKTTTTTQSAIQTSKSMTSLLSIISLTPVATLPINVSTSNSYAIYPCLMMMLFILL